MKIDRLILEAFTKEEHKPFNKVNIIKISKTGVVYLEDLAINRKHFMHIDKMENLKNFILSLNGFAELYDDKFIKFLNYNASLDFFELKLNHERLITKY